MSDLDHIWEVVGLERALREDLATYLRNVRLRRVEVDDEYEASLRERIDEAQRDVEKVLSDSERKVGALAA